MLPAPCESQFSIVRSVAISIRCVHWYLNVVYEKFSHIMLKSLFPQLEGTKVLWAAIFVNSVCGGMTQWFHNTVLNLMEEVLKEYLDNALKKTHNLSLSEEEITYIYAWGIVSPWTFGAMVGGATAHYVVEAVGRRNGIMVVFSSIYLWAAFFCCVAMYSNIPGEQ